MMSKIDFIDFYQAVFIDLQDQEAWCLSSIVGNAPNSCTNKYVWYQKAIDSVWRFLLSGFMYSIDVPVKELMPIFAKRFEDDESLEDSVLWIGYYFEGTEKAFSLLKEMGLDGLDYDEMQDYNPKLKEALLKIFDEAGVGFDKKCPYRLPELNIK